MSQKGFYQKAENWFPSIRKSEFNKNKNVKQTEYFRTFFGKIVFEIANYGMNHKII